MAATATIDVPYCFPVPLAEMFARTAPTMDQATRTLRAHMIDTICTLSAAPQSFHQDDLDTLVMVDVQHGNIVGLDTSRLLFGAGFPSACVGTPVPLGRLQAIHWITMTYRRP